MRIGLFLLVAIGGTLLLAAAAPAAPRRGDEADWPCQQRLVPSLSAASLWTGPALTGAGDWKAEPEVAALVGRLTPRNVSDEAGDAAIGAYAAELSGSAEKPRLLTLVMAGLLDETNRERAAVIDRLKELGRRQRALADIAARAEEELRQIPADAQGDEAAKRADLESRFTFVTQSFENTQRTMRYACEVPVRLEARLGRYARAIAGSL